jgi:hypothetical protein
VCISTFWSWPPNYYQPYRITRDRADPTVACHRSFRVSVEKIVGNGAFTGRFGGWCIRRR